MIKVREHLFEWGRKTYLMAIVNVTPDSFSDGGKFDNLESAMRHAVSAIENSADIIDIGGESTRPYAAKISLETELHRVIPVIEKLRQVSSIPISIDTTKAKVAEAAIAAGADIINDISGGTFDKQMLPTAGKLNVPIVLMHIRGTPATMTKMTDYQDLLAQIKQFLATQTELALNCGVKQSNLIIDPGIGFAKDSQQNIELLRRLSELKSLKLPILIGVSRKSFIGHLLNRDNPQDRLWGTAAACCGAIAAGADIVRVHDVAEMRDVCLMADAIWRK
ncbi:dihydropteroate synthase [Myxosarcina sp. GI1]|uniref:dihydropteroate synthase n=1 Tax=Myxosarcina sp. GI1 TaxID=1541065 RepID=UPI00056D890C|nr:dihydropteroate synthase [Myxosarcina sp. GI1]